MPTDIEQFLRLLFTLWVTANDNRNIRRITESNLKQCIQFEQSNDGISFENHIINNQQIKALFSNDNYLVIKLEDNIYLAITVCQKWGSNVLEITGKDFSNNREKQGFKTKYLVDLIKRLNPTISIGVYKFRKQLVTTLSRNKPEIEDKEGTIETTIERRTKPTKRIVEQEKVEGGNGAYYRFFFPLINGLTKNEEIEPNINYYKSVLTGEEISEGEDVPQLDSFYQQRQDTEGAIGVTIEQSCQEILREAGQKTILIRVKGARYMGKNSFVKYLLAHNNLLNNHQAKKVEINLESFIDIFQQCPGQFYQYLCEEIMDELDFTIPENMSVPNFNRDCTKFLEENIVSQIEQPLFLVIRNLHKIFPYINKIDFLDLLRFWQGKNENGWRKLIFILTYSTHEYPVNNIMTSPLWNIPYGKELGEYNQQEVINLVNSYQLNFDDNDIIKLINMVGGHPFLIGKALDTIQTRNINLDTFIDNAFNIYEQHLLELYNTINEPNNRGLKEAFTKVVNSTEPILLDPLSVFHLYSIGLVKKEQNNPNMVEPRCELYRTYFYQYFAQN